MCQCICKSMRTQYKGGIYNDIAETVIKSKLYTKQAASAGTRHKCKNALLFFK